MTTIYNWYNRSQNTPFSLMSGFRLKCFKVFGLLMSHQPEVSPRFLASSATTIEASLPFYFIVEPLSIKWINTNVKESFSHLFAKQVQCFII